MSSDCGLDMVGQAWIYGAGPGQDAFSIVLGRIGEEVPSARSSNRQRSARRARCTVPVAIPPPARTILAARRTEYIRVRQKKPPATPPLPPERARELAEAVHGHVSESASSRSVRPRSSGHSTSRLPDHIYMLIACYIYARPIPHRRTACRANGICA